MRLVAIFTTAIALSFTPNANAQKTGHDVLRECRLVVQDRQPDTIEESIDTILCSGYVSGLNDMSQLMLGLSKVKIFCIPQKETPKTGQVVGIFAKWLAVNPTALHERARRLFLVAMKDAYPCEKLS
jgi:hypothetical protein